MKKLCINCKYHDGDKYSFHRCNHPIATNIIDGSPDLCMVQRCNKFPCGNEGKNWELKEVQPEKPKFNWKRLFNI